MSFQPHTHDGSSNGGGGVIIEDIFDVKDVDPEGKKFDKVSRLVCTSENYEMDLVLDINTEVYPVEIGERITVALARTLDLGGRPDDGLFHPGGADDAPASLMDSYEYVMYGKVFNYKPEGQAGTGGARHGKDSGKVSLYVSFGGLLMKLSGDPHNMNTIFPAQEDTDAQQKEAETHLYILIRK